MGKVIPFPKDRRSGALEAQLEKLKSVSDRLDEIFIEALKEDVDPRELVGLTAHRLGTLLRNVDQKSKLWTVCEQVLRREADI